MSPRPQRTLSQDIVPEVVSAALALVTEEGPEGLTVRALARRANVAPMSIYNHFGGKNGVIDAIIVEGFGLLAVMADTRVCDPRENLLAGSRAYRDFALAHRAHYTVIFLHRFIGYTPSVDTLTAAYRGVEILSGQVQECIDAGYFAGRVCTDVAQQLWAAVHGYVALEISDINFASDRAAVFDQLIESLLEGLDASGRPRTAPGTR
jgi:AcrR family transcriptional regulator